MWNLQIRLVEPTHQKNHVKRKQHVRHGKREVQKMLKKRRYVLQILYVLRLKMQTKPLKKQNYVFTRNLQFDESMRE